MLAVAVDLIDQRHAAVPAPAREVVDTDRLDRREVAVRQTAGDGRADGTVEGVAAGLECFGDLVPRQALGPVGEEPGGGVRYAVIAGGPRTAPT